MRDLIVAPRAAAFVILLAVSVTVVSLSAHAQNYLYSHADFATGSNPAAVIIADFNGDGKLDLAIANASDNTVSVLLAQPDGTFAAKVDYPTGNLPLALLTADFNGDRKLDLAVVNSQDNTVSILLGNGDGTFQAKIDYSTGSNPSGIVAADFNLDKKVDLAVISFNDSAVSVLLGNGDGSFKTSTNIAVGSGPTSLATGDFNGDHKADLITSNIGDGTVTVLLSDGNGSFTRVDSPSGVSSPRNESVLAIGDFNQDGKADAIVSSQISQQLFLLLGNGDGTFQAPAIIPKILSSIGPLLAVDLNHDGKLDLICGNTGPGGISVLPGNGNGTFREPIVSPIGGFATSMAAADLNNDDQLDLAAVDSNLNSVDILLGNGKGSFGGMKVVRLASDIYGPDWAVAADFNGDGKLDLAVAEINFPNGQVSVELGKGNGTFGPPLVSPLGTEGDNANAMVAGDFNGDGKVDLFVRDSFSTGFEVLLGKGDGTFQAPVHTTLPVGTFAVGDFNSDGKTDLALVTNAPFNSVVQIYLSHGDGTFSAGPQYGAAGAIIVADVNQDGKPDLVLYGFAAPLEVLLGNGDGTFQSSISGPVGFFSSDMVAGDFNGDGKVDLAVGSYSGIAFLAGNGDGTFQAPIYSNAFFGFFGRLVAGDFNGDGKLDVVSTPPATTTLSGAVVMVGNGDGTFAPPISYGTAGVFADPIVAGDFNSDGVSDFALPSIGGSNGTALSLYLSSPAPNLFPRRLEFGKQVIGTTSSPQASTWTNVGNSPLRAIRVNVSGDFQLTHSCAGKIPISGSCSVDVTFTPTQLGTRTGVVTILDSGAASPQLIELIGIGVP